jgi:hypothetical protein
MTEREFLEHEMRRAKLALATTADDAKRHAGDLADLGYWARNYPWQTVGASAAGGFLLGAVLASKGADETAGAKEPLRRRRPRNRKATHGWAKPALTAALELARFVFQNVLLTGWQAAQAPPQAEPEPATAGQDT